MAQKSRFNLGFKILNSMNLGLITPLAFQEVIPGDEFHIRPQINIKFAPLVGPVVGLFKLKFWTFYVDYETIFKNFKQYYSIAYNDGGADTYAPYFNDVDLNTTWSMEEFWRYFLKTSTAAALVDLNAMPVRAYQKIYLDRLYHDFTSDAAPAYSSYYGINEGADVTTVIDVHKDNYMTDYYSEAVATQFYSTMPSLGGAAFTVGDFEKWLQNARNQSIFKKVKGNFFDYVKQLFNIGNDDLKGDNGLATLVSYHEKYFTPTEVLNTALTATAPLGAPGAICTVSENNWSANFKSKGFGLLMYIAEIEPIPFNFGVRKELLPLTHTGVYNPTYECLGNEPIYLKEVNGDPTTANQNTIYAYMPMYQHLRRTRDFIGGEFTDSTPLILSVHRPDNLSADDLYTITSSDYDYLFASYTLPQIRVFSYIDVQADRVVKNLISSVPDLTRIIK